MSILHERKGCFFYAWLKSLKSEVCAASRIWCHLDLELKMTSLQTLSIS